MSTGADWLLEALAAEGVRHLIGNPGSTELPITDAAGRQRAVRYVLALHEASVMGIADGYAQASGEPRGGQRARPAGARQRDVGDPERRPRPGAAAGDGGPAGAGPAARGALPRGRAGGAVAAPGKGGLGGHARRGPPAPPGARAAHRPRAAERAGGAEPPAGRPGRAGTAAARARATAASDAAGCRLARPRRRAAGRRARPGGAGRRRGAPGRRVGRAGGRGRAPRGADPGGAPGRHGSPSHRPPPLARPAAGLRVRDRPAPRPPRRGPCRGDAGVPALRRQPRHAPCRRGRRSCTWRSTPTRWARSTRPPSAWWGTCGSGSPALCERLGPSPAEARERRDRAVAEVAAARAAARARVEAAAQGDLVDPAAFAARRGGRRGARRPGGGRGPHHRARPAGRDRTAHARPPGWPIAAAPSAGGSRPRWVRRWPIRGAA